MDGLPASCLYKVPSSLPSPDRAPNSPLVSDNGCLAGNDVEETLDQSAVAEQGAHKTCSDELQKTEHQHAACLLRKRWVVEKRCQWTIFEDKKEELEYHSRRSKALCVFVKSYSSLRKEYDRLQKCGLALQDAYEDLQADLTQSVGDAAYWQELAIARAELQSSQDRDEQDVTPVPPDSMSWDWPLSRNERKARIKLCERHMEMYDRQICESILMESKDAKANLMEDADASTAAPSPASDASTPASKVESPGSASDPQTYTPFTECQWFDISENTGTSNSLPHAREDDDSISDTNAQPRNHEEDGSKEDDVSDEPSIAIPLISFSSLTEVSFPPSCCTRLQL